MSDKDGQRQIVCLFVCLFVFYVINIIDLKLEDPIRQQIQYTGCTNIQIQ